jgi:hypothetical protein
MADSIPYVVPSPFLELIFRHITRANSFGRVFGGKIDFWNWVGTKYGIESAMSHKILIFKAGINFSSPADSCYIV